MKQWLRVLAIVSVLLGLGMVQVQPAAAVQTPNVSIIAAIPDAADKCNRGFFGLVPWYHYMQNELDGECNVKCFNVFQQSVPNDCGQRRSDIPGVLLAIIDSLLRIAGLVAIAFVIAGSFKFIESRGNSEKTAQAQSTIINALAGLIITIVSVGFVAFLGSKL